MKHVKVLNQLHLDADHKVGTLSLKIPHSLKCFSSATKIRGLIQHPKYKYNSKAIEENYVTVKTLKIDTIISIWIWKKLPNKQHN